MNKLYRICISLSPVFVFICAISISAQWNKKPYTEWCEKEATKLLNDSKFIFPRNVNGKPVIAPDSTEIKFYSGIPSKYGLNMRFKVKDMMVDGKLEY